METILSRKNCHRAKTVRPVNAPESSDYTFGFRAVKKHESFMFCTYAHTATAPNGNRLEIVDADFKDWIVTSWLYEENLEDLYEAGVRAFSGTSQIPNERAAQYIREYEQEIQEDLKKLPEEDKLTYFTKYHEWVATLFARHSRIMSAMVVGPAKFPTSKNQRASDAYDRAYQDFRTWREKFFKNVERRIEAAKPQDQREEEEWQCVKADLISSASTIFGIDTRHEPYNRALMVSNLYNRMETLAKNGKVEMLRRAADFIKELNVRFKAEGGKEIFTSRHKFWKLAEKAEETLVRQAENANRENEVFELHDCTVVKNYEEDRLQIFHEEKPAPEVISLLKKEAWKWSRNNVCWQRQLTRNACYSAARVILGGSNGLSNTEEVSKLAKKLWDGHQE